MRVPDKRAFRRAALHSDLVVTSWSGFQFQPGELAIDYALHWVGENRSFDITCTSLDGASGVVSN